MLRKAGLRSLEAGDRVVQLVRDRHSGQMRRTRSTYLNMVDALTPSPFRARLLAMDLDELRVDDQLRRAAAEAAPVAAEPALPESAPQHVPEPTPHEGVALMKPSRSRHYGDTGPTAGWRERKAQREADKRSPPSNVDGCSPPPDDVGCNISRPRFGDAAE